MDYTTSIARCLLVGCAIASGAVSAAQKFELAGVEVNLPEGGWELQDAKAAAGNIGAGGVDGNVKNDGKLMLLRSASGQVLAALLVRGSRGVSQPLRFRDTACPEVPLDVFYARRLAKHDADPPQCLLMVGPVDSTQVLEKSLPELRAAKSEHPFDAPALAWMVVAYAFTSHAAQFSIEGLVSTEGFAGLPVAPLGGALPATMPPAVAAWGDAVGASMQKALEGMFSRSTSLPPITFAAAPAPR